MAERAASLPIRVVFDLSRESPRVLLRLAFDLLLRAACTRNYRRDGAATPVHDRSRKFAARRPNFDPIYRVYILRGSYRPSVGRSVALSPATIQAFLDVLDIP